MCQASSSIHHGLSHLRLTTNLSQLGPLRSRWSWECKQFIGGQCLWKTKGGKGSIGQGMFRPQCRSDAYEREQQQAGQGEPQTALQSDQVLAISNSGATFCPLEESRLGLKWRCPDPTELSDWQGAIPEGHNLASKSAVDPKSADG